MSTSPRSSPVREHKFDAFDILPKWDYLALAKAFGAKGYRVQTISELNAVLHELKKPTDAAFAGRSRHPRKGSARTDAPAWRE